MPVWRLNIGTVMSHLRRWPSLLAGLLLLFLQQAAYADVWGYIDEKGVAHFAAEKLDDRYEIFYRGGESFDTSKTPKNANDTPRPVSVPTVPAKLLAYFDVSPSYKVVKHHLREASNLHKVDYELLQALIATESGFDAGAVSPKGAIGLMQIMPDTARRFGVDADKKVTLEKKLFDPKINVRTGTRYLRLLIDMFPGRLDLALASYNAGEGAVQKAGNQIPNFKETQNYVKTVMQLYTGLKPPAALTEQRYPTRIRMEMLGGAARRGNMLAPIQPANGQAANLGTAQVSTTQDTHQ
jgi:soluble lytic murein transglycosylase-like protein